MLSARRHARHPGRLGVRNTADPIPISADDNSNNWKLDAIEKKIKPANVSDIPTVSE